MSQISSCDNTSIWPKRCSMCQAEYSVDEWEKLHYIGVNRGYAMGFDFDLEYRYCASCGNDMAQGCVSANDVIDVIKMRAMAEAG